MIGLTVVGKPMATVRTSSPSLRARLCSLGLVRALSATRFALEPLLTKTDAAGPDVAGQRALELLGEAARRQPAVEAGVDEGGEVVGVEDLARDGNRVVPGTNSEAASAISA